MNMHATSVILYFYGVFLIVCGLVSVTFIGKKAKTAIMSGGTTGAISILIGYLVSINISAASIAGIILSLALLIVFSWRSTKTLFTIFHLLKSGENDLKGKGIAFLIISLMAVVSIFVSAVQIIIFFAR